MTTDHLPECSYTSGIWYSLDEDCICDRLRACEQRVLSVAGPHNYSRGRKDGYADGVQAARDAVAGLSPWRQSDPDEVLAAIDALREEKP